MQGPSNRSKHEFRLAGMALATLLAALATPAWAASSSPLAKMVAEGKHLFMHETFGGNGMTCAVCHTAAGKGPTQVPGRKKKGPSLSNAAAVYPRYKARARKVVTLEDQIRGCIHGALRGKAPAYDSDDMRALVTYITSLAQGKRIDLGGAFK